MAKQKHVHKYRRHRHKSGNVIYFCALPDCNSKINPALALGKKSICWRCGNEFLLTEYAIRLAKPHCDACHKPKGGIAIEAWTHPASGELIHKDVQELVDKINKLNQDEVVIERRAEPRVDSSVITEVISDHSPEPVIERAQAIESGLRSRLNHLVKPDDEDI